MSDLDDAAAEADAAVAPWIEVPLNGETLRVLPVEEWPSSAARDLNQGDYTSWAEKCLVDDSDEDGGRDDAEVWLEMDPKIGDLELFFLDWERLSGQSRGKSRAARRSSRRTRRR